MGVARIAARFAALAAAKQAGFVAYVMAGDPDFETSKQVVLALPGAGADIIELGFPFSDPMADGVAIQKAGIRALANGMTLTKTLELAGVLRAAHPETPIILMGYANPIYTYGVERFAADAAAAGVDGTIVVDLPPEEDHELRAAYVRHDLAVIRLATPTTDAARLPAVIEGVKGFVYYVSVAGTTGDREIATAGVRAAVSTIRDAAKLPVVVGFGIKTADNARATAASADAVVVGTAIVDAMGKAIEAGNDPVAAALAITAILADATHGAPREIAA
jgi:tryptophan synthase alpha chain